MWAPPPSPPPSASPQTWIDFFQSQDANYTYKNSGDPAYSYYPHNAWNQYYFADVDCSAYVAWVTYNVMNTQRGNDGYVMSSTKMAQTFAQTYNFGTWTQEFSSAQDFTPGDIFSMNGHVWICLGVCGDGSMVILHSTPSDSKAGQPGGGLQLSGVGESEDCQAVALAQTYMSRYFSAGEILANLFGETTATDIFDDIVSDAWYAQAVDYVLDRGLMAGTSANTFSPETSTSRGMLVTILYNLAGKPQTDVVSFSDVDSDAWYAQAVAWAASKNIVAGYGNGIFGPNDPLTREQTAAILYRFAQVQGLNPKDDGTLSGFSDQSQVQERALSAMEWAVSSGLISGTDLGTLIPQAGATRAQMAVILINFCQQMDK